MYCIERSYGEQNLITWPIHQLDSCHQFRLDLCHHKLTINFQEQSRVAVIFFLLYPTHFNFELLRLLFIYLSHNRFLFLYFEETCYDAILVM